MKEYLEGETQKKNFSINQNSRLRVCDISLFFSHLYTVIMNNPTSFIPLTPDFCLKYLKGMIVNTHFPLFLPSIIIIARHSK